MQALSTIVEPNCDISDFGKGVWPSGVKTSYCSDRVVDLAREKKWEDVHFGTFLGLPPWWLDLLEPDLYKCVNWRELLVYGIAKCYRGIMDVYDHELGPGHIPDYMLQYVDEVQDVLSRPRPVPDYGDAAVVPPHPFDSMSFVDGEWHYGHVTCGTMPEEGDIDLSDHAEHGEEARPPKKYRLLFDAFLKGEGAIVDAVDAIVREGLARLGRTGFVDHRPGVLGPFGTAIAHYSLEVGRPRPDGRGYLTLVYLVPFDPPPNATIEVRVLCDAQGRLSIVSAMVVLPDGTEERLSRVPKSASRSRPTCAVPTSASASPSSRRSRDSFKFEFLV